MGRIILLVALVVMGGFSLCYFGSGILDCRYESNTAQLMDQINDLPPTAAGRSD